MSKLSARNIQIFVAGAFAYLGLDSLLLGINAVIHSLGGIAATDFIVGAAVLVIGVAILAGSGRALLWAQIVLWLTIIQDIISICVFVFGRFGISLHVAHMSLYRAISSLIEMSALLFLIVWSRSKHLQDSGTPNTALEPTPTAP